MSNFFAQTRLCNTGAYLTHHTVDISELLNNFLEISTSKVNGCHTLKAINELYVVVLAFFHVLYASA